MTTADARALALWVVEHINYFDRWRWTPPSGGPAVVMVIHGFHSGGQRPYPYDIEFSHFYVMEVGREVESLPHGQVPLPDWFRLALTPISSFVPYHMNCDAFKRLVDAGHIVAYGRENQ